MSRGSSSATIGTGVAIGVGVGVADVVGGGVRAVDLVGGGMVDVVSGGTSTAEVATSSGVGMADVASAAAGGTGVGLLGFFTDIGSLLNHIGAFLSEVAVGLLIGGGIVAGGFLLLALLAVVIEVRAHRSEQVPAPPDTAGQPPAAPAQPPSTLLWVHVLLPSNEGAAWVAEVTSCLAEAQNDNERRRHVRSYRRAVPQLIWTSWAVHLRGSRSRTLS